VHGTRDRARKLAAGLAAAGALLLSAPASVPADAQRVALQPQDALTLVRQTLAALEATPPNLSVASEKLSAALHAQDSRGVDMARVTQAAQAFGLHDPAAAAAQLLEALRPAMQQPGGIAAALLVPAPQARFTGTPAEDLLLVIAAVLVVAGGLIIAW
jgi:hypothetical protein